MGASELLFVYACAAGAGCLKQTDEPTGEVAQPRSNLDHQKGEEVDQEAEDEAKDAQPNCLAVDFANNPFWHKSTK